MKKGFTLAEIMIVLTVIGILAAILLPTAQKVTPDENVIKLKRTHKILSDTISELITSDKFFINSNFNYDINGNNLTSATSTYFCYAFTSLASPKSYTCTAAKNYSGITISNSNLATQKAALDASCKSKYFSVTKKNTYSLTNGAIIYHFNSDWPTATDTNGLPSGYHLFCIDVDGIPSGATSSNCVNECPFGYAIRNDGRIITSTKVDEWLNIDSNQI